jgi:transposase InsO family protein
MEESNNSGVGDPAVKSPDTLRTNHSAVSPPSADSVDLDAEEEEDLTDIAQGLAGDDELDELAPTPEDEDEVRLPFLSSPRKRSRRQQPLTQKEVAKRASFTPQQRLLLLDIWQRSGLPANDFGELVGVTNHTLYAWKRAFEQEGPSGLMDKPKVGPQKTKLHELTKRTILMLKEKNPDWGCQRISDMLLRGPALPASPSTVAKVLHGAGYEMKEVPTKPHPDKVRSFERAQPNQLWQTDLFTFILKRQNRRVYLVAFMDDHSRFIVSYGLHASQSSALVMEVLRVGITSHGTPQEILTDNGSQYVTWRGKSAFTRELEKRGIRQVVAAPRRPQTLGKIERFWGTLWRECLEATTFLDMGEATQRIGLFIDYYNFQRPHQGMNGLVPADRFFGAAPDVLRTLKERVAANALELARNGTPKKPFYLTGSVGGKPFSVHAEGERVILMRQPGQREEIDLAPAPASTPVAANEGVKFEDLPLPVCPQGVVVRELADAVDEPEAAPGTSPIDDLQNGAQA